MFRWNTEKWFMERIIMLLGGSIVFIGSIMGYFISIYFILIPILVSTMMIIFALTGYCPSAMLLHALGAKSTYTTNKE